MSDLISRQYAIEHYQHVCRRTSCKECPLHIQVTDTLTDCELELFLHNLPSAQPERKKGKWIIHPEVKNVYGGIYIECSECHTKYVVQHIEDEKYCRNCGADMRGEANE